MQGIKLFGLSMMLMSVTACAPVVYDATYRAPTGNVSVQTVYTQPSYRHVTTRQQVHPIEITLYADNNYAGAYFRPIQLVISDGQYVEIPVKNRRGHYDRIYAHYHKGDLHFDSNRSCSVIKGSARYSYDKRWDKGHKYTKINAGKDYDLRGLRLQIRNKPIGKGKHQVKKIVPAKSVKKKVVVYKNPKKSHLNQKVVKVLPSNKRMKVLKREQLNPVSRRATKASGYYTKNKQGKSTKVLITKDRSPGKVYVKTDEPVNRPAIVKEINKHEKMRRKVVVQQKNHKGKTIVARKSVQKQAGPALQIKKQYTKKANKRSWSSEKLVGSEVTVNKKSVKDDLDGKTVTVMGRQVMLEKKDPALKKGESRNGTLFARGLAKR